jgi:hypothetical protein
MASNASLITSSQGQGWLILPIMEGSSFEPNNIRQKKEAQIRV